MLGISTTLHSLIQQGKSDRSMQEILDGIFGMLQQLKQMQGSGASPRVMLLGIYSFVDKMMSEARDLQSVSCRKGCAFCCKMNVDVTPMEVMLIVEYAKRNGISIDKDYLQRQAALPKDQLAFTPGLSACVFLRPDNTCSIYPVRPLACRKYVVANPPERCNPEAYPKARLDVLIDVDIEILVSALDNLQLGKIDGLHKVLLDLLSPQS